MGLSSLGRTGEPGISTARDVHDSDRDSDRLGCGMPLSGWWVAVGERRRPLSRAEGQALVSAGMRARMQPRRRAGGEEKLGLAVYIILF